MFEFKHFNTLTDQVIDLKLNEKVAPNTEKGYVPTYKFNITLHHSDEVIGTINIRIGYNDSILYCGHVGYAIDPAHRGNHYAYRACELIKEVASAHNMNRGLITCNPDNMPSRRTCERLGAKLLEVIEIPPYHNLYAAGERQKCIYEWLLG